jgi:hypothetical protein
LASFGFCAQEATTKRAAASTTSMQAAFNRDLLIMNTSLKKIETGAPVSYHGLFERINM